MLTELRTLIAVNRYGTFAAAADRIGLTQSAVSSQIKRLEDALGFAIFDRTGRSAHLNVQGHAILVKAETIVQLFDGLSDVPHGAATQTLLHIGAIASVQSTLLTRALKSLRREFPAVPVKVSPGVSMQLMNQLDSGEIDLAVMIRPPFGLLPELRWYPLVNEPFVLIAPSSMRSNDWAALLQSSPFLRYDRTSFGGRQVERFLRTLKMEVRDAIELDDIHALIRMVASGLGVAMIPMAETYLKLPKNVRAISLGDHTFYREIGVLTRARKTMSLPLVHLLQCLQECGTHTGAAPTPGSNHQGRFLHRL